MKKPIKKKRGRKSTKKVFIRLQNIVDLDSVRPGIEYIITKISNGKIKVTGGVIRLRERFQIK